MKARRRYLLQGSLMLRGSPPLRSLAYLQIQAIEVCILNSNFEGSLTCRKYFNRKCKCLKFHYFLVYVSLRPPSVTNDTTSPLFQDILSLPSTIPHTSQSMYRYSYHTTMHHLQYHSELRPDIILFLSLNTIVRILYHGISQKHRAAPQK